jgi:flagellar hook-length control protein FliK
VTVMPNVARVSVESADGDLALHLRIKDGNAEVSMTGSLAPMFEQRSNEVQTVLAGEGLNLGRFDLGQDSRQGQQQSQPQELPGDDAGPGRPGNNNPARATSAGGEQPVRRTDGRIHVTA